MRFFAIKLTCDIILIGAVVQDGGSALKFDFEEVGSGPAILFLPGSYSFHNAWRGVVETLKGKYRTICTSLPGYGGTEETRNEASDSISEMLEFMSQVIDRIGEPIHLVGHSYGGLTAYATALEHPEKVLSFITFEGNPIYALRNGIPYPWIDEVREMVDSFEEAIADGDPDAPRIIIDFWRKPGVFDAMPDPVKDYCRYKAKTNRIDWKTAAGFTPDIRAFSKLSMPSTVVRGELANQMIVDISNGISESLPDCLLTEVAGSNHFLISTHLIECAAIVDSHMQHYFSEQ